MPEQHNTGSRVFIVFIQLLAVFFGAIVGAIASFAFFTLIVSAGDDLREYTAVGGGGGMLVVALAVQIVMRRKYPVSKVSILLLAFFSGAVMGLAVTFAFFTLMGCSGDIPLPYTTAGGCAGMFVAALAVQFVMKRKYPELDFVLTKQQNHYLIKAIPALDTLPGKDFEKVVKYCGRRVSREPKAIALNALMFLFVALMLAGIGITTRSVVLEQRVKQHEQDLRILRVLPPGDTRFHASEFNPTLLDRFILNFLTAERGILLVIVSFIAYFVLFGIMVHNLRNRTIALCPEALDALGLNVGDGR